LKKTLVNQNWTVPQRKWLERIGKQLKVEVIVDREALDQGEFKSQGGFQRIDKVFQGKLEGLLLEINSAIWEEAS